MFIQSIITIRLAQITLYWDQLMHVGLTELWINEQ